MEALINNDLLAGALAARRRELEKEAYELANNPESFLAGQNRSYRDNTESKLRLVSEYSTNILRALEAVKGAADLLSRRKVVCVDREELARLEQRVRRLEPGVDPQPGDTATIIPSDEELSVR